MQILETITSTFRGRDLEAHMIEGELHDNQMRAVMTVFLTV